MEIPESDDTKYNPMEVEQIIHHKLPNFLYFSPLSGLKSRLDLKNF
jgi:hypothetical protein